ncbi:hypothetical protein KKB18_00425 [bacterium]|nr:hypothetical protein [bacterium]
MKRDIFFFVLIVFFIAFSWNSLLADETRAQFEQSSRIKSTSGLLTDVWDDLYLYTWYVGTLEDKHYLWTNLSNLQKDHVTFDENAYQWATDEKENILGKPGWDSNNAFALGYAGNIPGIEKWKFGFMGNFQTFDFDTRTDNANYSETLSGSDKTEFYDSSWSGSTQKEDDYIWLINFGRPINDELSLSGAWYHWNSDQEKKTDTGTYSGSRLNGKNQGFNFNNTWNEYKLKESGDTASAGFNLYKEDWYFQLIQGYADFDFNHFEIDWTKNIIKNSLNEGSETKTEGKDLTDFAGNENRSDFGFDLFLRVIRQWGGDIWKKTFIWGWVGFHPEDGDYSADQTTKSYRDYPNDYGYDTAVNYDIDGYVDWNEFNTGIATKTFMNFSERILFAWGINYEYLEHSINIDYDNVVYYIERVGGKNVVKSTVTSYGDHLKSKKYYWSFPVAFEVNFLKNLVGRVGAKWTLTDSNLDSSFDKKLNDETDSPYWMDGEEIFIGSKSTLTTYSFGLGWRFSEYLQIDLMNFTDLEDMSEWQMSATLIW